MKINKVILADTNALFTDALRIVLEGEADFEVRAGAGTDARNIRELIGEAPDVLVIHQSVPDAGLVAIVRELRRIKRSLRLLFIVHEPTGELFTLAGESSSIGIMSEAGTAAEFISALRAIARGERYISRDILTSAHQPADEPLAADPLEALTPREREVLYWLSLGYTNREISDRMILSEKTVKNHVSHVLKKLEQSDRTKAAALAWKCGLPIIEEEFFSLSAVQPVLK